MTKDILKKLDEYLDGETSVTYEEFDDSEYPLDMDEELYYTMIDFFDSIKSPNLTPEQQTNLQDIIEWINDSVYGYEDEDYEDDFVEDSGSVNEAVPIRKRRDLNARRQRRREYKQKKARLRQKSKMFRKKAVFKRYKRKQKKMAKFGRTARGARKKTWINK